jgi:hypothetical protein
MMTDAEKASKEVKQNSDESSTSSSSEVQGKEKLDQTGTEGGSSKFHLILFFSSPPVHIVGKEKLKDQKASEAKESNQHPKSDKKSKKKSRSKSNAFILSYCCEFFSVHALLKIDFLINSRTS